MKEVKRFIIILVICSIIISIVLIINRKKEGKYDNTDEIEIEYKPILSNTSLKTLNVRNRYFVVKEIVEKYYNLLCTLNKQDSDYTIYNNEDFTEEEKLELIEQEKESNKRVLFSFFDKSFISYKNLNIDNMDKVLGVYKNLYVDINQVKYIESINMAVYFINGQIIEKETSKINSFSLMLVIDSQNSTFNLYTEDYIKEKKWDNFSKETFELLGYTKVENRTNNQYSYELISDETYCNSIFKNFINRLKYNRQYSYNILDKTYKDKKFKDLESYESYVGNLQLNGIWLEQYKINKGEKNKEIICVDNTGKIWVFYENAPMEYKVLLDTYTVDLPEFIETYNKANTQEKTALNIQKIVDALNDQDYRYVYSKLAESFKIQNFKTLESFEEYSRKTFGLKNKLEFEKYEKTTNYTTYKITLKNDNNRVTKTIIMDLKEETNFVFSFNVD